MESVKGKTTSGFLYEIDKNRLDDYEFLELVADVEENPLTITKVANRLLGIEQKQRLLDFLREEDGRVPLEKIVAEFTDIFNNLSLKN